MPAQLNLEPPVFEEDIGDLGAYLALPSTISRASSVTINSSNSSPGFTTDDELDHPSSSGTARTQSFGPSSSSHSLSIGVSRFQSLISAQEGSSPRPLRQKIDALEVDPISVARI